MHGTGFKVLSYEHTKTVWKNSHERLFLLKGHSQKRINFGKPFTLVSIFGMSAELLKNILTGFLWYLKF